MFPNFNLSGVIPPFKTTPTDRDASPYVTNLRDVVSILGTSPERRALINGLLDYRQALRAVGVTSGFQIFDGSFTENCEALRGRPPSDIDLVTYAYLPVPPAQKVAFLNANLDLFDPRRAKILFGCDAYFVDMGKDAELVVDDTFYWYGLFSHQKSTAAWKGMLRVSLMADDLLARNDLIMVAGGGNGP